MSKGPRLTYAGALALGQHAFWTSSRPAASRRDRWLATPAFRDGRRYRSAADPTDPLAVHRAPRLRQQAAHASGATAWLRAVLEERHIRIVRGGDKSLVLDVDGCEVDLWLADVPTWGYKQVIRTGSGGISRTGS